MQYHVPVSTNYVTIQVKKLNSYPTSTLIRVTNSGNGLRFVSGHQTGYAGRLSRSAMVATQPAVSTWLPAFLISKRFQSMLKRNPSLDVDIEFDYPADTLGMDPQEMRRLGHKVVDLVIDRMLRKSTEDDIVQTIDRLTAARPS